MNQDPSPQAPVTNPAKRQLGALYLTNPSIFGAKPMILEWTHDDRLRLFIMGPDGVTAVETLFDIPVLEVELVKGSINMMYLFVAGVKHRIYVTDQVVLGASPGGAVGLALAQRAYSKSGIKDWIQDFKVAGVKTKSYGFGFIVLVSLGIVAAIIVVTVLLVATNVIG